jgi:hypothetical protein
MLFASRSRAGLGRAMVGAVSNRRGVVRLPALSMGICDGNCGTGTGSVRVLQFSPVTFSTPIRRTLLHLDATSIRMTSGRSIGTFKESGVVSDDRESFPGEMLLHYFWPHVLCTS